MLLFLIISLSCSSSITLYTSNKYVVEFSCNENPELCSHCSSEIIYKLEDLENFQISGYLSSTLDQVKLIISDLQDYMESESWYLSLNSEEFCFNIKDFESEPEYEDLLNELVNVEYFEYSLPDLDENEELDSIFVLTELGSYDGYLVNSLKIDYKLDASLLVADEVLLKSKKKRLDLAQSMGVRIYTGIAKTSVLNPKFQFSFDYKVAPSEIEITVYTKSEVVLQDWYNSTYYSAGCENVASPRGLDSVHLLPVNKSLMIMSVGSSLVLEKFINEVYPPEFSINPGILLTDNKGFMTVSEGECSVLINSLWDNVLTWNSSLYAEERSAYSMSARLLNSPYTITLEEYSQVLDSFYSNFSEILPQYSQNSSFNDKLLAIILENPYLVLLFNNEINIELSSLGQLDSSNDVELDLNTYRENSVIQTKGKISISNVYKLLEIDSLSDPDFSLDSMSIGLDGVVLNINVSTTMTCNSSAICSEVSFSCNCSSLQLAGIYYPDDFFVYKSIDSITLADLLVQSSSLLFNLSDNTVQINGTNELKLGGESNPVYECKVTSIADTSYIDSLQDSEHRGLPGCSSLYVLYSKFLQGFNLEKIVFDQVNGICGFKGLDDAWNGDLQLELTSYQTEKYSCDLQPTDINVVVKYLTGMTEPDTLVKLIDFPYGVNLVYESDFLIEDVLIFLGVYSKATAKTLYLPNALMFILDFHDFYTAYGNLQINSAFAQLEIYSSFSQCEVLAEFRIWGLVQETSMIVAEEVMMVEVSGNVFAGLYNVSLEIRAGMAEFDAAEWTVGFSINVTDVEGLVGRVNESLVDWVYEGQMTLQDGLMIVYEYQGLSNNASYDICGSSCPISSYCTSKLTEACTEKAEYYNCSESIASCDPEITCKGYGLACLDDNCTESVYYCEEYIETCTWSSNKTQCIEETLEEMGIECMKKEWICEKQEYLEEKCRSFCQINSDISTYYNDTLKMLNDSYYKNLDDMQGFFIIDTENMFQIISISSLTNLNQSGIGQNDIQVQITFEYWKDSSYETASDYIYWDFINEENNLNSLVKLIRTYIVSNSDTFTNALINKTPQEVYSESLSQIS